MMSSGQSTSVGESGGSFAIFYGAGAGYSGSGSVENGSVLISSGTSDNFP
jgi:hypothetical protein